MNLLGIDFGLSTIGLSLAQGPLAEPLVTKNYQSLNQLLNYLKRLCHQHQINQIIIGLSEGQMAIKTKAFAQQLQLVCQLPVIFQDETLSTHEARQKLIQAQAPLKKRRSQDHTIAATIILQAYLDRQPKD